MDKYMNFTHQTIKWYGQNKRNLPWRDTKEPYYIWLSEIIMQQTKVAQGTSYYLKFIEHYPTVHHLAAATEDQVLKNWQGLGYYSRARNLHFTAKFIAEQKNGIFPNTYEELLQLKGVGEYTAAAIASFAFNIPKAVVDGNVFRVLSRMFGVFTPIDSTEGKKEFKLLAQKLLDVENPADNNQAIMEFGALQCIPSKPDCENCPLRMDCFAYHTDNISTLPLKSKKLKQKNRFFNYLVIGQKDTVFLKKRTQKDIWQNLYDFPLIETSQAIDTDELLQLIENKKLFKSGEVKIISSSSTYKHVLSHQKIYSVFTKISINDNCMVNEPSSFPVSKKQLTDYAVPKLLDNYLQNESNLLYLF